MTEAPAPGRLARPIAAERDAAVARLSTAFALRGRPATATEPELRMTLLAQNDTAKAQLLAALRTLRPAMAGAAQS